MAKKTRKGTAVKVKGYSYKRKGHVVHVKGYTRKRAKR
jgi:hypothetical protein